MNILQVIKQFSTQEVCIKHLEFVKWGDNKPVCPFCNSTHTYTHKHGNQCYNCKRSFSVTVNTIFHDTKIPLQTWFLAIAMFMDAKKGISAKQLERNLDVSYPTAWRMLHQIRKAMGSDDKNLFQGIVEIDETYVGGKPKKKDDDNKRGRGTKKTTVVGIVDRDTKKVHAEVMLPNSKGKKLTGKQLLSIIEKVVIEGSEVMTDEFKGYNILDSDLRYFRNVINHSYKEYANGDIHTNSIESFWAVLKRGVFGIYHHVSVKHLQAYVNEFVFRYNNRENGFNALLNKCV